MSRRALVVSIAAAGLLALIWFVFLWGPQGGELDDANARIDAASQRNAELELRLARLQDAQDRAPELAADLEELRRAVPDDPELAQFILDANDAASDAGVEFLSIAPGVPAPGEAGLPPVVTLGISVSGGYFEVLDYLDRLEDLPRIVVVDQLTLTPTDAAAGSPELSVNLTARMFATSAPQIVTTTTTTTTAPPADTDG